MASLSAAIVVRNMSISNLKMPDAKLALREDLHSEQLLNKFHQIARFQIVVESGCNIGDLFWTFFCADQCDNFKDDLAGDVI
jgi:hypothetical protein